MKRNENDLAASYSGEAETPALPAHNEGTGMTLIELIKYVGQENVTLQPLERDLHEIRQSSKHGCTLVTFGTKAIRTGDIVSNNPNRKVGIVLWIPKGLIPEDNWPGGEKHPIPIQIKTQ